MLILIFHRKIYLRISELSELSGVPVKAIRGYLGKGILPQPIIAGKRLRYYTRQHLKRLRLIKEMESSIKEADAFISSMEKG